MVVATESVTQRIAQLVWLDTSNYKVVGSSPSMVAFSFRLCFSALFVSLKMKSNTVLVVLDNLTICTHGVQRL